MQNPEPTPDRRISWPRATAIALTALLLLYYTLGPNEVGTNLIVVCSVPFFGGAALFAHELAPHETAPLYTALGYLGLTAHTLYALLS